MAQAHAHSHSEAAGNYFLDQLCTIAACGALGTVAILMFESQRIGDVLTSTFWKPVFYGGLALVALAIIRAGALWQLAGRVRAADSDKNDHDHSEHSHSHAHGEACDDDHGPDEKYEHEHGHGHSHAHAHGHEHSHSHAADDHGHDHGWAPWRYIVLLLPVVLYALKLPAAGGFSKSGTERILGTADKLEGAKNTRLIGAALGGGPVMPLTKKQSVTVMRFNELANATLPGREKTRDFYEGSMVQLKGQLMPVSDKEFQLYRMKMTCCAADAIPLKARIISPVTLQKFQPQEWVTVTGELQFRKVAGQVPEQWLPVIMLDSEDQIQRAEKDNNEYEQL
jgi:DUF1980 C-terminal domain